MQSGSSARRARVRRPWAFVVRDPTPDVVGARVDWSAWYLTDEEDMGQSVEQGETIEVLRSSLGELAAMFRWEDVLCASDNFFGWVRDQPLVRVSPDVYLLDDPPPPPYPRMWQTWLPGHRPPRWALEIVSEDVKKDYEDTPLKYAQLGTRELVIFDPQAALRGEKWGQRVPLQIYRRDEDGAFVRVYAGEGPVWSDELGACLVARPHGASVRLRIALDPEGKELVPTAAERARSEEQARRDAEQARRDAEQARRDAEQRAQSEEKARRDAEERVRALEAELARVRSR